MNAQNRITLLLALFSSLFLVSVVLATPAAPTLDRTVIGGGGGHAEAGILTLDATIGQALVGIESAAPFDLCSGFWCGEGTMSVYLPLILCQSP